MYRLGEFSNTSAVFRAERIKHSSLLILQQIVTQVLNCVTNYRMK